MNFKEIKPVNPKGNQPWIFIGRTDAEAEAPILWSPEAKSWLIGKDPDPRKDWMQKEKGTTEDEMVMASLTQWIWILQTPGDSGGQWSLVSCSPWGCKESDTTWQLNKKKNKTQWNILCTNMHCEAFRNFYEEIYIIEFIEKNTFGWRQVRWYFFVNLFSSGFTEAMILSFSKQWFKSNCFPSLISQRDKLVK